MAPTIRVRERGREDHHGSAAGPYGLVPAGQRLRRYPAERSSSGLPSPSPSAPPWADWTGQPDGRRRNQARFVFLDPHARELYRDWPRVAADAAAMLRLDAGRHPDDPALSSLVGELSTRSEDFRRFWSDHKVHQRTTGTKDYHHPLVGDLTVTYQALTPGDDPDQILFIYNTEPGSPSEAAMRLLARWNAPEADTTSAEAQEVRQARE
ncbi:hypothetical protein ACFYPK_28145 [Streptomyces halstedii]